MAQQEDIDHHLSDPVQSLVDTSGAMQVQHEGLELVHKLQGKLEQHLHFNHQKHQQDRALECKNQQQNAELKRLRKQNQRLSNQLSKSDSRTEAFSEAKIVENYALPLPGEEAKFILSTNSTAHDNDTQSARMTRAYSNHDSQACVADQAMLQGTTVEEPERSAKRRRSQNSYSNIATNTVWIQLNGMNTIRSGIGGVSTSEAVLIPRIGAFFQNFVSIKTLSQGMPLQLQMAAKEVRAEFAARSGYESRRMSDEALDKKGVPINVTGNMCRKTLTDAIHASYLCLDRLIIQENWFKNCTSICVNMDGSAFNDKDMYGSVMTFIFVEEDGRDGMGYVRLKAVSRRKSSHCLPVADKISLDVRREDGSLFRKEVPCQLTTAWVMSGHLYPLLNHPNVILGMDKGSESKGGGKGVRGAMEREAFCGTGSPMENIFITRRAVDDVLHGPHAPFLRNIMNHLEVPSSEQFLAINSERLSPEQLDIDPEMPVPSLRFTLKVLHRQWDKVEKKHIILKITMEEIESRPSTKKNPLAQFPCRKGLGARAKYCDKHALNRAGVAYTNYKPIKRLMKWCMLVNSECRKIQNHTALKHNIARILGLKGADSPQLCHLEIRLALGAEEIARLQIKFPLGLQRAEKGAESRWNSLQKAVADTNDRLLITAATFPIALGIGETEAKTNAGVMACSKDGFKDKQTFAFNEKQGRCFYILNQPSFRLHIAVQSMIHELAWRPLLAACADNGENATQAMCGVNSMLTTVLLVLRKELFVVVSGNKADQFVRNFTRNARFRSISKGCGKWTVTHRLGHRGPPSVECSGKTYFSTQLARLPKDATNTEPPALLHRYRKFYNRNMPSAINSLMSSIVAVCRMVGSDESVLPHEYQQIYTKPQDTFGQKIEAAQWFLYFESVRAADCIEKKMNSLINNPLGFLAGMHDVVHVRAKIEGDDFSVEDNDETIILDIATDIAIANANLLLLQMKELIALHGPTLSQYLPEPLKSLLEKEMPALEQFAQRSDSNFAERGMTILPGSERAAGYPKPVTAFPGLSKLAMTAAACITNGNFVESSWSYLTGRHHANVRHVGPEFMSGVFRHTDHRDAGMLQRMNSAKYEQFLAEARAFRRRNIQGYRDVFRSRFEESQDRASFHKRTQAEYRVTGIAEKKSGKKNMKDSTENQSVKQPTRKRASGKIASRNKASGSERSESSESDSDEEDDSDADNETNGDNAAPERNEDYGQDENAPGSNEGGSSPRPDSPLNEIADAGQDLNGSADLIPETLDGKLASWRAAYQGTQLECLKEICKHRSIIVKSAKGQRCRKEDYINALLEADAASFRMLHPPSPSVASSSEAHSVVGCPPQSPVQGSSEVSESLALQEIESHAEGSRSQANDIASGEGVRSVVGCPPHSPVQGSSEVSEHLPLQEIESHAEGQCSQANDIVSGEGGRSMDEDGSDKDESDLGSEFDSDGDFDLDVPSAARRIPMSKDNSESAESAASGIQIVLAHPFPDVKDVSDQQAREHPWKFDSVRSIILRQKWKNTQVEFQLKGKTRECLVKNSVILTRLDGKRFPLKVSPNLLYVLYTDNGLEFGFIEAIEHKIEKRHRKEAKGKVIVKYTRALRTEKAIQECSGVRDHEEMIKSGVRRVSSLGRASLKTYLQKHSAGGNTRLVFHRGDFPFETSAENVVGFVAWQSAGDGIDGMSSPDNQKVFLSNINNSLRLDSSPSDLKLGSLSEIDCVYLGPDFSEPAYDDE